MADKATSNLPALRVTERLETALMRLAARDERSLSDYIRLTLERHAFGHGASLSEDDSVCLHCNALHCDAKNSRGGK